MISVQQRRAVGTFTNRQEAEQALKQLYYKGFPIDHICVVSKDSELLQQPQEGVRNTQITYATAGKAPCAMITGSMLGAIGGCLTSIGILSIPGVAPLLAIGGVAGTAVASTIAGAGIGLAGGGLISACTAGTTLYQVESDRSSNEEYLVMVTGTNEEVHRAERILASY